MLGEDNDDVTIVINEISTGNEQYVEIFTDSEEEVDLQNVGLVGAEESANVNTPNLRLRFAVDLSGTKIPKGQKHAIISTKTIDDNGNTIPSLIPPPTNNHWRFMSGMGAGWLDVSPKNFLALFLVKNTEKKLFDVQFPPTKRTTTLNGQLLQFVQENLIDSVILKDSRGPDNCKQVDSVLEKKRPNRDPIFDDFLVEQKNSPSQSSPLTISRCFSVKPNDLRSFKHSKATPLKLSSYAL